MSGSPPTVNVPSLKILWLATKAPWPPIDGGRLVAAATLEALARAGHRVDVLGPGPAASPPSGLPGLRFLAVEAPPRGRLAAAWVAQWRRRPWTLVRHEAPALRAALARQLEAERYDLVHVEQVQGMAAAAAARERNVPVVLRAQNVEAELWSGLAAGGGWRAPFFERESRRLARAEGEACAAADAAIALTERDAGTLAASSGRPVERIAAPAAAELPPGPPLPGDPPLVVLGSSWPPNRDGARDFCRRIWPELAAAFPAARLHVFGLAGEAANLPAAVDHGAPAESASAFPANGVLVVPLAVASGVRMKILEAWARGVPVIASSVAARGLDFTPGVELLVADDAAAYRQALARLADAGERARLVAAGRAALRVHHDPERIAAALVALYRSRRLAPGTGGV